MYFSNYTKLAAESLTVTDPMILRLLIFFFKENQALTFPKFFLRYPFRTLTIMAYYDSLKFIVLKYVCISTIISNSWSANYLHTLILKLILILSIQLVFNMSCESQTLLSLLHVLVISTATSIF